MSKAEFDGGGFVILKSYHDVRLPAYLVVSEFLYTGDMFGE